jgi:hypothetical protein
LENSSRKATDVLLSIESKIDTVLSLYKSLSFDIKILSNKVNYIIEKQPHEKISQQIKTTDFSVDDDNNNLVNVKKEDALPVTDYPVGFRRTSRPETYVTDQTDTLITHSSEQDTDFKDYKSNSLLPVNVVQRIVDKNGKSLFLAEVEIISSNNPSDVIKTRTNAAGKWQAQLTPGEYKVFIRKRESVTKNKIETLQTINVDGTESLLNLDMLIIK